MLAAFLSLFCFAPPALLLLGGSVLTVGDAKIIMCSKEASVVASRTTSFSAVVWVSLPYDVLLTVDHRSA